jgi:riboflavin kinase/FMN adenylyltransferase
MEKYFYPSVDSIPNQKCALALGFFDGVHAAHRSLILCAKKEATLRGLPFGIFTFNTESGVKADAKRIYGDREKLELFENLGADFVICSDFESVKGLSPEDFVKKCLFRDIGCAFCVAGFNFRFGYRAAGDADALVRLMRECGGDAMIQSEFKIDEKTVSATEIRALIESGDVARARLLLGSPYFIEDTVTHGKNLGTKLGYPTVNMELGPQRVRPARGVYRSAVMIDGNLYAALTNIGVCPTFDERDEHAETYILNFKGNLYERRLRVYLLGFLREEKQFSTADELLSQIEKDKKQALKENGEEKWQELGQSLQ